jgi:hypothetical protein
MSSNSQVIIQDIRTDFAHRGLCQKMLDYVTGEQARMATADAPLAKAIDWAVWIGDVYGARSQIAVFRIQKIEPRSAPRTLR